MAFLRYYPDLYGAHAEDVGGDGQTLDGVWQ